MLWNRRRRETKTAALASGNSRANAPRPTTPSTTLRRALRPGGVRARMPTAGRPAGQACPAVSRCGSRLATSTTDSRQPAIRHQTPGNQRAAKRSSHSRVGARFNLARHRVAAEAGLVGVPSRGRVAMCPSVSGGVPEPSRLTPALWHYFTPGRMPSNAYAEGRPAPWPGRIGTPFDIPTFTSSCCRTHTQLWVNLNAGWLGTPGSVLR